MRIARVTVSPVAFYTEPLWKLSYAYRTILVLWRLAELTFVAGRFLLIRAPFLLAWTRLPMTKSITLPGWYGVLQSILSPERESKVGVAGGRTDTYNPKAWEFYGSPEDIRKEQEFIRSVVKPPGPVKVAMGGVIRGLVTEWGTVFIKFAQIVSMRPELPDFIREELSSVQDKLPGLPEKQVNAILEKELMKPVGEVFEWVNYTPIAAASLGAVYHAKLRHGEEVALKIQRPFLPGIVTLDTLIILKLGLGTLSLILPLIRKTDLTFFTLSFERGMNREINFQLEGRIQELSRQSTLESEHMKQYIKIARVYEQYTTKKLLTMEYVRGLVKISDLLFELSPEEVWDILSYKVEGLPPEVAGQVIILIGCRFPMHLSWAGGPFHGDLHLANIYLTRPEQPGAHWKLFLCDFGMFEDLTREQLGAFTTLWWGVLGCVPSRSIAALQYMHLEAGGKLTDLDWGQLYFDLLNFGRCWQMELPGDEAGFGLRNSQLHEGGVTRQLLGFLYGKILGGGLRLPYWFWLAVKSYLYLEDTGMGVTPSGDWWGWIFDQYAVRREKDGVLRLFDETNVFTYNEALEDMKYVLGDRGRDYEKVLTAMPKLLDDIKTENRVDFPMTEGR